MTEETSPREILTFTPPGGTFNKADYEWLAAVRVTVRGGDGGGGPDGTPGQPGETNVKLIGADELPETVPLTVGEGGKGAKPHGANGADGFVILELFDYHPGLGTDA